ncbi:endonuclease domain-containing protein [Microbacterium sp. 22242]|uniref:endonuclease domain-containing protein n=1 Tax=Microbacterium sp. 22242 TaxID=3453896 RepID=UPI003F85B103
MRDVDESAIALRRLRSPSVFSAADLTEQGFDRARIRAAVAAGVLVHARRGRYLRSDVPAAILAAVRSGGRLDCLSLLELLGVFVKDKPGLHVRVPPNAGRFRADAVVHWRVQTEEPLGDHAVSVRDAAIHAVLCQKPRAAVATIDSLLHLRLLTVDEVDAVFRNLPKRLRILKRMVDGSAESGPETLVRLILRTLPVSVRTQVVIVDVGRVDFLIDGWLIIECDGRRFHEGWDKQVQDRHRDVEAAAQGYVTVRFTAADVLDDSGAIRAAIARILEALGPQHRRAR